MFEITKDTAFGDQKKKQINDDKQKSDFYINDGKTPDTARNFILENSQQVVNMNPYI